QAVVSLGLRSQAKGSPLMSLPARDAPPPADASLSLQFDPADADLLARAFRTPGDGARAWRLNGEANRISLVDGFDQLLAWPSLRGVTRYEHQERTALRVLREMRGRAVLADEVGLGKTIEAGLILKEYAIRGLVRRALILSPPSLTTQWKEEMETKFGLPFRILRSPQDWDQDAFVIASMDTAKRPPHRTAAQARTWDLVIVDEAHRLKNRLSQNWRFVAGLSKKYMLLLTATPVQNDMGELFNLVSLLKPGQLHTYDGFLERFVASADRRVPAHVPELRARLRDVMVRNRRGIAFTLPPRRVHSLAVRLSPAERRLYDEVTDFVRDAYWSASGRLPWTARLTLIVLQREIGSSTFAVAETLARLSESPVFGPLERERLEVLREEANAIASNVKASRLTAFLESHREKALVFTQYVRTLRYLQGVLESEGYRVAAYHGGLSLAAKDEAVRAFRDDRNIFLSTEAGGEGRNLQFARTVVNYDLPWNPLRIEQRIGRVHRLGQDREVHVVNLWAEDTVEAYLMELLDRKIHMFELVVGELDLILGNVNERRSFEDVLMDIWALRQAEDRRAALRRLGDALVRARARYETAKERSDEVLHDLGEAAPA
ncbi:MAG: DEAD/DEAH box helicase, partial [Thermoplasmata archaeon]|nr:DEAD/DEAH box helicase [Thermoplasmata archaeon]